MEEIGDIFFVLRVGSVWVCECLLGETMSERKVDRDLIYLL